MMAERTAPRRVVIVGAGFAGFECARRVCRLLRGQSPGVQVSLISPEDYLLYTPLLPDVAGGSSIRGRSRSRWRSPCPGCT